MAFQIGVTPEFRRDYKKLNVELKERLKQKGKILAENPFHPLLRTHKLTGKLFGVWSFSVDMRIRVLFEFIGDEKILFHRVGDHSVYRPRR